MCGPVEVEREGAASSLTGITASVAPVAVVSSLFVVTIDGWWRGWHCSSLLSLSFTKRKSSK